MADEIVGNVNREIPAICAGLDNQQITLRRGDAARVVMTIKLVAHLGIETFSVMRWSVLWVLVNLLRPFLSEDRLIRMANQFYGHAFHPGALDSFSEYAKLYPADLGAYIDLLGGAGWIKGKRIVDLGCGIGQYSKLLREAGASEVVGVDTQNEKLQWAVSSGFLCAHSALTASAEAIPLEGGSVDTIFSHTAFEHFPQVEKVLMETYRLLKPGGLLVAGVNFIHHEGGHHLFPYIRIQWPLGLFSEESLCRHWSHCLKDDLRRGRMGMYKGHGEVVSLSDGAELHLNRMDFRGFETSVERCGFSVIARRPSGAWARMFPALVQSLPWSRELTGTILYALQKNK